MNSVKLLLGATTLGKWTRGRLINVFFILFCFLLVITTILVPMQFPAFVDRSSSAFRTCLLITCLILSISSCSSFPRSATIGDRIKNMMNTVSFKAIFGSVDREWESVHLCQEMHLTLYLGTLYKTDLFAIYIWPHVCDNYLCFSKNLGLGTPCDVYPTVYASY